MKAAAMCAGKTRSAYLWPMAAIWAAMASATMSQTAPQDIGVGVELVLAVDVSRSIDPSEQIIQRQGYAEAFRSPEVQDAILNGGWGQVAITYVEWAGAYTQSVAIPWTLIDSRAAANDFAARIEGGRAISASRTSISGAIDFSATLFDQNGFAGMRRVIDVSGDGPNNNGRGVIAARDEAIARGITINGLPLMTHDGEDGSFGGRSTIPDLDQYYADCVIGGPGAFWIPATRWDQFASAVRQKLVLELAGRQPPDREILIRVQAATTADCLIGERLWEERQRRLGD
jgi:hypothetical protein